MGSRLLILALLAWCNPARAGETCVQMEFLDARDGAGFVVSTVISIESDGLVRWSEPGLAETRQARIDVEHKNAVIEELVESLRIDEIDSEEMWDEIVREGGRTGLSPRIQGAATTRIFVKLPAGDSEEESEIVVECPACHLLATRYPEVESLQRFAQCQVVLENLRAVMQVGGFDESQHLAEQANDYLGSLGVVRDPLTCRDLRFVRSLPGGARFATFCCDEPSACNINVTLEPGLPPVFQVVE